MNQLESLDWKRRKENADRIIAEQQAMFDRFNNVQKSLAQQQQEGSANRQNPMLQGGGENLIPLGIGTITRKPCARCEGLKEQLAVEIETIKSQRKTIGYLMLNSALLYTAVVILLYMVL